VGGDKVSFVKKSVPPPEMKEGEVVTARVVDVEYPVEGRYGKQVRFRLALPNGYECSSWMKYYDEPSDKSALGSLSITFMDRIKGPVESVKEVLEGLKKTVGRVYVKCKGFREYEDRLYPKFQVVSDRLPSMQRSIDVASKQSEVDLDRLTPEQRKKLEEWLNPHG